MDQTGKSMGALTVAAALALLLLRWAAGRSATAEELRMHVRDRYLRPGALLPPGKGGDATPPATRRGRALSLSGRLHPRSRGLPVVGLVLVGVALALVLGAASPAAAMSTALVELDSVETSEHFVVEAPSGDQARQVLEYAEQGWQELSARFPAPPATRVHIVVADDDTYERIQPAPMTRGFATFGGNRIFLRASQTDREVVVHELVHIFLGKTIRQGLDVPDWFNEGIAQYASGAESPMITLIYEASAGNLLALAELDDVDALRDENRQLATLQGLAVVQFLVDEFGEARLWELVENLSVARSFEQAMFVTYGYSDLEINERWMAYAQDTYSLLSPAALRLLLTLFLGALALIAAAVWFFRRTVGLYGGDEPGLHPGEVAAARFAEELLERRAESPPSGRSPDQEPPLDGSPTSEAMTLDAPRRAALPPARDEAEGGDSAD